MTGKATHGKSGTKAYGTWERIHQRCNATEGKSFKNYRSRGITVCERWKSFENFYADMGDPPSAKHTIERLDNDRGYGPDNCVWATYSQQARNRRSNVLPKEAGNLMDVVRGTGLPYTAVRRRLHRGWSLERALSEPLQERHRAYQARRAQ